MLVSTADSGNDGARVMALVSFARERM